MTTKEKLIEALNTSLEPWKNLPELILREDIYDETGHVDLSCWAATRKT